MMPRQVILSLALICLFAGLATALNTASSASKLDSGEMNFFISSSSHRGNNSHDGTSPTAPWLTLEYASQRIEAALLVLLNTTTKQNTVVHTINIALECGSVFLNDPLVVQAGLVSWQLGIFFRIRQYNCGEKFTAPFRPAMKPAPLIQFTRTMATGASACLFVNQIANGGLTIEGLQFSGCQSGISLTAPSGHDQHLGKNILIQGNTFQDIHAPYLRYTPVNPNWRTSIAFSGMYHNLTIQNNIAARVDLFIQGGGSNVTNLVIQKNTVQECGGNCFSMGLSKDSTIQDNVFNRDLSERVFLYGTTDIIIGGMSGRNVVQRNDFNQRGEYTGAPDGCAFDFETSAAGFEVADNIFYKSYGSGIMIFGHANTGTSQNLTLSRNIFNQCGCESISSDSSAIAILCGGGHRPSGTISDSVIYSCPGPNPNPPIHVNSFPPHCAENMHMVNNSIDPTKLQQVERPELHFAPPNPMCNFTNGTISVFAKTRTDNSTLRYTLDGSRPTSSSPILDPKHGLELRWPSATLNFNVKGFRAGFIDSITNGAVMELNYVLCREARNSSFLGPSGKIYADGGLRGNIDHVAISTSSKQVVTVTGWAVDTLLPGDGLGPVTVMLHVDAEPVVATLANWNRPDLVKAGIVANPEHGFNDIPLPSPAAEKLLSPGVHFLTAKAIGTPGSTVPTHLSEVSEVKCVDGVCENQH